MVAEKTIIDELVEQRGETSAVADNFNLDFNPVDPLVSPDSLYDPATKAMYDAEPKRRVFIPTPEGWKQPYPYAERIQINGIVYIIQAEQDVMLPESVWSVWENKRKMERLVNQQVAALERIASYSHINQVPHYIR